MIAIFLGTTLSLRADIQNQKILRSPDRKLSSRSSPLLVVPAVSVEIFRGEAIVIPIKVSPYTGGGIAVEVTENPQFGHLESFGRNASSPVLFRYIHDRSSKEQRDTFGFRVRDYNGTWSAHRAEITIRNPPATIAMEPEGDLDFGKVPVGSTATRVLTMSNSFGTTAFGNLVLPPPWSIAGDSSFVLKEGEARSFAISFAPWRTGEESAKLVIAPAITNVPVRYLNGEGIPPFRLISSASLVVTNGNAELSFSLTNATGMPLMIGWDTETLPPGIQGSPSLTLPPHGSGEKRLYLNRIDLAPESSRSIHPLLVSGTYSFPIEILLKGPRSNLMLELLRGAQVLTVQSGVSTTLQGIIRNSLPFMRTVQLQLHDDSNPIQGPIRQVTIPPSGVNTFDLRWDSSTSGVHILSVRLSEDGKIVGEGEWRVFVTSPPSPPPSDSTKKSEGDNEVARPSGIVRLASETEVNNIVLDLRPSIVPGLLRNSLMLRWRYPGSGNSGFVIEEKRGRNHLSSRGVETTGDEWVKVDLTPVFDAGFWKTLLPVPWPGIHVYRVYPDGFGEKPVATEITFLIRWRMVVWPYIRMLLGGFCLFALIRVIRARM
jgi:hypothetical protein